MITVKKVYPHQLAWLRRPECDKPGIEIWEKPSGELYAHDPRTGTLVLGIIPREALLLPPAGDEPV